MGDGTWKPQQVGIEASRIGGIVIRFGAATVIRFVADMIRRMRVSTRANDGAQNRGQKYCDQSQNCGAPNHRTYCFMPVR